MKALTALTLAILMALSTTALAAEGEEQASCEQIADVAKSVMSGRQGGVSMGALVGIAKGNALIEKMVVEAFESGRYSTKQVQDRQISEFRDKWFLWCFKSQ